MRRLLERCVDDSIDELGYRPDIHLDWPPRTLVTATVARAVHDALELSLRRISERGGSTSAIVSLAWRTETVELCVVDDGCVSAMHGRDDAWLDGAPPRTHLVDAWGLEHDVDEYGDVGVCQWWSIPVDLS